MTINQLVKSASISCIDRGDWVVLGEKIEGGGINFGNFKTSTEAQCVVDFINSAIQNGIKIDSIQYLNDALDSHTKRFK